MKQLTEQVVQWAQDKGLLMDVTPERIEKQTLKVLEELGETAGAYLKGNRPELVDGIGDVAVTLIILGAMKDHEIEYVDVDILAADLISITSCLVEYRQYHEREELVYAFNLLESFAKKQGLELSSCLQSAYDVISKRTGKMVNGTFIKDK